MTLLMYTNKLKIQNTFKIYVICFLTTSGFMYLSGNFYLHKGNVFFIFINYFNLCLLFVVLIRERGQWAVHYTKVPKVL